MALIDASGCTYESLRIMLGRLPEGTLVDGVTCGLGGVTVSVGLYSGSPIERSATWTTQVLDPEARATVIDVFDLIVPPWPILPRSVSNTFDGDTAPRSEPVDFFPAPRLTTSEFAPDGVPLTDFAGDQIESNVIIEAPWLDDPSTTISATEIGVGDFVDGYFVLVQTQGDLLSETESDLGRIDHYLWYRSFVAGEPEVASLVDSALISEICDDERGVTEDLGRCV